MFAMRESTNNDKLQEDTGLSADRSMCFDISKLPLDDGSIIDDVLGLCAMGDDDRDARASSSRPFDDGLRDGPRMEQHGNSYRHEEEPEMALTCGDFGFMPFCPVDTRVGDDFLGLTPTYWPDVNRLDGYQIVPEVATSDDAVITSCSAAPSSRYPTDEMPSNDCGFTSPFRKINKSNANREMIQEPRTPVAASPITVRSAFVPVTSSRTVSPSVGCPGEDYTAAWQQHHGSGSVDFFAEVAPQPNGVKTVSIPDLSLAGQHCIIKTQMGLAVLLNSKDPNNANIPGLHQSVVVKQPTSSNVLGLRHSNADNTSSRKFQRWSPEEDELLKKAVETEGGPPINWKRIASKYFSNVRSALQCKSRWTKALKPGVIRGAWTPEEDACILRYKQEGLKWSEIAEYLPGRMGEHICDRYNNVLDPELKKTPWTKEEDHILFQEQRRIGNKWTQISQLIPGRSENSVKNRWHNLKVTRQRRERCDANRKRQSCTVESSQGFVVTPSSSGNLPQGIAIAPPSDRNLQQEFAVAPPSNAHTIFRPTSSPTTTPLYQV